MAGGEFMKKIFNVSDTNNIKISSLDITVLVLMSFLMYAHLHYRTPDFPFTSDSSSYIEQARSLVNTGSALVTPYNLTPIDKDQVNSTLFPIGFPITIAAISLLGFDAKDVAIGIGQVSAIAIPWLLFFCFRKSLGNSNSLIIAAISIMSPGIQRYSPMALTDVFSLAIVVSSIALILNSKSTWCFIFGGLLAGIAYAVRNAHLALLITVFLYFFYFWFYSNKDERYSINKHAISFILGVAIIVAPLLIRNILLFNSLNPYEMESSNIGFIENLRTYIEAFANNLTANSTFARYIAWSIPGLLMLSIIIISSCYLIKKYLWCNYNDDRKRAIIISTFYIIFGSCIVIAARTRYEWGEVINIRHTLQYTPFVFAALFAAAPENSQFLLKVKGLLIAVLLFFHVKSTFAVELLVDKEPSPALNAYKIGEKYLCFNAEDTFLVSNWAHVFIIECRAHVRNIQKISFTPYHELYNNTFDISNNPFMNTIIDIIDKVTDKPIIIGFFPGRNGFDYSDFPINDIDQKTLLNSEWIIIRNDENGLLIKYLQ